jgi:SAM-dependent methyltransferase
MDEILRSLPPGARVLDLGCRDGSFRAGTYPELIVIRLDRERPPPLVSSPGVQADAARLPFPDECFDAVISNHSLEHMDALDRVLCEVGRVVRPTGSLFVSVPDASTFSDRLYRWIYHGGGHVNPFRDPAALAAQISLATGLKHVATRSLHASFLYLERRHFRPRPPRRMWLFANGDQRVVVALSYLARLADRRFGTRLSVYGWAFYFGDIAEPIDVGAWTNVCVRCGGGCPAELLAVRGRWYVCPVCGARNLFTPD